MILFPAKFFHFLSRFSCFCFFFKTLSFLLFMLFSFFFPQLSSFLNLCTFSICTVHPYRVVHYIFLMLKKEASENVVRGSQLTTLLNSRTLVRRSYEDQVNMEVISVERDLIFICWKLSLALTSSLPNPAFNQPKEHILNRRIYSHICQLILYYNFNLSLLSRSLQYKLIVSLFRFLSGLIRV